MSKLKPMLAETLEDSSTLSFPVLASPKLDGIRCLIVDDKAVSRNLKPIPNQHVQGWVTRFAAGLEGLDGELVVGEHDQQVFQRTTSTVMSANDGRVFTFWCFDSFTAPSADYRSRMLIAKGRLARHNILQARMVPTKLCNDDAELKAFEEDCLARGFEGVMVRKPDGHYKFGRSTLKEGLLLKVKRFKDSEATVIGWQERMHNDNAATTDALGHTERSSHKAGMRGAGDLGALVVQDVQSGVTFNIGSGFTAEQRVTFWKQQGKLMGQLVKYKHFPIGAVDKPRFPTFIGFRDRSDTSE